MKKVYNGDAGIPENIFSLECTPSEIADLWFVVEDKIKELERVGLQNSKVYPRLKELEKVFSGKGASGSSTMKL